MKRRLAGVIITTRENTQFSMLCWEAVVVVVAWQQRPTGLLSARSRGRLTTPAWLLLWLSLPTTRLCQMSEGPVHLQFKTGIRPRRRSPSQKEIFPPHLQIPP